MSRWMRSSAVVLAVCLAVAGAPSRAAAVSVCGTPPTPGTQCWGWVCDSASGDWLESYKPLGTRCSGGVCDGEGLCVSTRTGTPQYPRFVVASIVYEPPGNRGVVSYGTGSSEGGSFEVTTSAAAGLVIESTVFGAGLNSTYTFGKVTTTAVGFARVDSEVANYANPGTYDVPNRKKDVFVLWINPKMTHYSGGGLPDQLQWTTSNGGAVQTMGFTAAQLLGEDPIPYDKVAFYSTLTPADRLSILAMHPAFGNGQYKPERYQKVNAYQLRGPDNVGDMVSATSHIYSYSTTRDSQWGSYINAAHTILASFNFLGTGGKAGVTYEVRYQETRSSTTGEQKRAEITMGTATVCYVMDVDLYIDAAFGTYLAVPVAERSCNSPVVSSGQLTTPNGAPAANQALLAPTSTGLRIIYTDAAGNYRSY